MCVRLKCDMDRLDFSRSGWLNSRLNLPSKKNPSLPLNLRLDSSLRYSSHSDDKAISLETGQPSKLRDWEGL